MRNLTARERTEAQKAADAAKAVEAARVPPTLRQMDYLRAIEAYVMEQGWPPTLVELGERCGTTPNSARCALEALINKGMLVHTLGQSRALRITDLGRAELAKWTPGTRTAAERPHARSGAS